MKVTVRCSTGSGYTSITPTLTLQEGQICCNNCAARSIAYAVYLWFTPRSKRPDASERIPNAFDVRRIDGPLNTAASNKTFVVLSVTSLVRPPITPATPIGPFVSAMISMDSLSSRSLPSSVVSVSPAFARRAIRVWSATQS